MKFWFVRSKTADGPNIFIMSAALTHADFKNEKPATVSSIAASNGFYDQKMRRFFKKWQTCESNSLQHSVWNISSRAQLEHFFLFVFPALCDGLHTAKRFHFPPLSFVLWGWTAALFVALNSAICYFCFPVWRKSSVDALADNLKAWEFRLRWWSKLLTTHIDLQIVVLYFWYSPEERKWKASEWWLDFPLSYSTLTHFPGSSPEASPSLAVTAFPSWHHEPAWWQRVTVDL